MSQLNESQEKFGKLFAGTLRRAAIVNYYMMITQRKRLERLMGESASKMDEQMIEAVKESYD